jgi:hypothetical protein
MDKKYELLDEAKKNESKAQYRANKKYYTEDEKKTKKERLKKIREMAESMRAENYKPGDMYIGWHCSGVIQKINAKTVLIKG